MRSTELAPLHYNGFVILGAQSAIAQAFVEAVAPNTREFVLVGRNIERLQAIAHNLTTRHGVICHVEICDLVEEAESANTLIFRWQKLVGKSVDCILVCHGYLGRKDMDQGDLSNAKRIIDTNYMSAALWSIAAANAIKQSGRGRLLVVGSVAGDRGKKSNYVYGSAKAALETLVEGLNHELSPTRARAVLIKPGMTDTPMTAGFEKSSPLWSTPDRIAKVLVKALRTRQTVLYAPFYWRAIMFVLRLLPDFLFRRLGL